MRFRRFMEHHLNPLHVYCRLKDLGMRADRALRLCSWYERFVYRLWSVKTRIT